jgi:hypothetical protein
MQKKEEAGPASTALAGDTSGPSPAAADISQPAQPAQLPDQMSSAPQRPLPAAAAQIAVLALLHIHCEHPYS